MDMMLISEKLKDEHIKKLCGELPLGKLHVVLECIAARVRWTMDDQRRFGTEQIVRACQELEDIAMLFDDTFNAKVKEKKRTDAIGFPDDEHVVSFGYICTKCGSRLNDTTCPQHGFDAVRQATKEDE
jgi:hypothetical protein